MDETVKPKRIERIARPAVLENPDEICDVFLRLAVLRLSCVYGRCCQEEFDGASLCINVSMLEDATLISLSIFVKTYFIHTGHNIVGEQCLETLLYNDQNPKTTARRPCSHSPMRLRRMFDTLACPIAAIVIGRDAGGCSAIGALARESD